MEAKRWNQAFVGERRDCINLRGRDFGDWSFLDRKKNRNDAIRTGKIAHGAGIAVDDHVKRVIPSTDT